MSASRRPPARRGGGRPLAEESLVPGLFEAVRGQIQAVAQLTGVERAAKAMDRFAASAERASSILDQLDEKRVEKLLRSAERAAAILERIEREVDIERAADVMERLDQLADTAEQMNRSLKAVEQLAVELRRLVTQPFSRLPIPIPGMLRGGRDEPSPKKRGG